MKSFIISETEKRRILNMHKSKLFNEGVQIQIPLDDWGGFSDSDKYIGTTIILRDQRLVDFGISGNYVDYTIIENPTNANAIGVPLQISSIDPNNKTISTKQGIVIKAK